MATLSHREKPFAHNAASPRCRRTIRFAKPDPWGLTPSGLRRRLLNKGKQSRSPGGFVLGGCCWCQAGPSVPLVPGRKRKIRGRGTGTILCVDRLKPWNHESLRHVLHDSDKGDRRNRNENLTTD